MALPAVQTQIVRVCVLVHVHADMRRTGVMQGRRATAEPAAKCEAAGGRMI